MSWSFGAMTRVLRMCPLNEALARIAAAGFTYTALLGQHEGRATIREDMSDADVEAVRRAVAASGLRVLMAIGGAFNPLEPAPFNRKVEFAAELKVPVLLLTGLQGRAGLVREPGPETFAYLPGELERAAAALSETAEFAAARGVRVAVKPHGGPTGTAAGLSRLAEATGGRIGIYYDPGNLLFYTGIAPETDLPAVAKWTTGLCIKDHAGPVGADAFPTPGDGEVDWPRIFGTLKDAGFDGPALIEILPGRTADDVERELARSRHYLLPLLERVA